MTAPSLMANRLNHLNFIHLAIRILKSIIELKNLIRGTCLSKLNYRAYFHIAVSVRRFNRDGIRVCRLAGFLDLKSQRVIENQCYDLI